MILFESLLVAFSTYSALPMPQFEWNRRNMQYAICFFPMVGLVCGLVLLGWHQLCRWQQVSEIFFAAGAVILPLLLTGGIHMDGYMDTVDALSSHQPKERKLEILKDSHCGAFAILYCGIYLVAQLGLWAELYRMDVAGSLWPLFILSRAFSAFFAVFLPNARGSGMLCTYTENTHRRKAIAAILFFVILGAAALACLAPLSGSAAGVGGLLGAIACVFLAMKEFEGVTGDICGFLLQICEISCLAGAWIGGVLA